MTLFPRRRRARRPLLPAESTLPPIRLTPKEGSALIIAVRALAAYGRGEVPRGVDREALAREIVGELERAVEKIKRAMGVGPRA